MCTFFSFAPSLQIFHVAAKPYQCHFGQTPATVLSTPLDFCSSRERNLDKVVEHPAPTTSQASTALLRATCSSQNDAVIFQHSAGSQAEWSSHSFPAGGCPWSPSFAFCLTLFRRALWICALLGMASSGMSWPMISACAARGAKWATSEARWSCSLECLDDFLPHAKMSHRLLQDVVQLGSEA